ncbi:MAG: uncharacterized membrane protein YgdD (TMEM256/DUF423 family) [Enterobacterales bacterium]|jgi:uncharacterized membrane protein YgdD (TMEM256/DUF423 family)
MTKIFLMAGTIGCFLSVALGAFAAHSLKELLTEQLLTTFHTAVQYQFFHSLGLIMIALVLSQKPKVNYLNIAGMAMIAGIVLFSGSLYILALTGITSFGIITPFGGIALLVGWSYFSIAVWKEF